MSALDLSIVIVNYNGLRFLSDCIDSIKKHFNCAYEIIVVDNASVDDSCSFLKKNYPDVVLIASKVNTGFTGGNNIGVASASADLVLLLNNDTIVMSDITPALSSFNDPTLGALGCRMFYVDGSFQSTYGFDHNPIRLALFWSGLGDLFKSLAISKLTETNASKYDCAQNNVAWVSGAFLLTRKVVWDRLGGLDCNYFMYVEDVDYCKRVILDGYRIEYTPQVKIIHYGGAGRSWLGFPAIKNTFISYMVYTNKFYGSFASIVLRFVLSCLLVVRSGIYLVAALLLRSSIYGDKCKSFFKVAIMLATNKLN